MLLVLVLVLPLPFVGWIRVSGLYGGAGDGLQGDLQGKLTRGSKQQLQWGIRCRWMQRRWRPDCERRRLAAGGPLGPLLAGRSGCLSISAEWNQWNQRVETGLARQKEHSRSTYVIRDTMIRDTYVIRDT